jgi:transposase
MGFVQREGRTQGTLSPVCLEELIPDDHVCRVIDAFVGRLDMAGLGFERARAAETGRPGYDPRDLLKLYLYGCLQQIRSSRRLESECRRNIELMWLLARLAPDHKTIAEFRRMHREGVTAAGRSWRVPWAWLRASGLQSMAQNSAPSAANGVYASARPWNVTWNSWSGPISRTKWSPLLVRLPAHWRNCASTRNQKPD